MKKFKLNPPPVFYSMRFMMTSTYIAVIIATLFLMSVYILGALSDRLEENALSDAFGRANMIADGIGDISLDTDFEQIIDRCITSSDMRCIITDSASCVLYDTNTESELLGKVFTREVITRALAGEQNGGIVRSSEHTHMLTAAVPSYSGGEITAAVYLVKSADDIDGIISSIRLSLIIFSAIIVVLIGMLSFGISFAFTTPIEEFMSVAEAISRGDFSKRIKTHGKSETARMAQTLNFMCDRLSELETNRKKFVSDVSHELKTPMATIKVICDSLVDTPEPDSVVVKEFLVDLSDEIDRLTRLIDRLLTLTRLDASNAKMSPEPVDFVIMTKRIISKLSPMAISKGISVEFSSSGISAGDILLDYDKIWEALYNIIDNAIKYSPESGSVKVDVTFTQASVITRVTDNGSGIADNEKEHIFERFYRLDDSRARDTGGTGLGLSIARDAVLLHNGSIRVTDAEGGGSVFTVTLPLIPAESVAQS